MAEKVDIKKMINDLKGNFSKDNESQLKGVQLLKGLAISDEKLANQFMDELDKATTQIANKLLSKDKINESNLAILRAAENLLY